MKVGDEFQHRYTVSAKIGDGGMQSVFAAHDRLTDRAVAIKTPLLGQRKDRFLNSAWIAARVNHSAVAKTYDCFDEDDTPFLIEELIEGPNLEAVFPEGAFVDPHCAARIFLTLAKGIAASHHAGVIHRDLKPSNIVTPRPGLLEIVKITDFGIATLTESVFETEAKAGDITRSTSGTVRGALPYMAPEMMFRKPGDQPGASVDVWSLGALMFKITTGAYPFGVGFEAVANVKTGDRAGWPQFMTNNGQYRDLSLEIQKIVEACLIYSSEDRPTIFDVVEQCGKLCFSTEPRRAGLVSGRKSTLGWISSPGIAETFFHRDSTYGPAQFSVGQRVMFSRFPGVPKDRAHPVSLLPLALHP